MPVINCLKSAKVAYKNTLSDKEIESVYEKLMNHKKIAEQTGANLLEEMNKFGKELSNINEEYNRAKLLQDLVSTQAVVDNLQREELFRAANMSPNQSVYRSLFGKMVGSSYKVARNHENTYSKKLAARDGFIKDFSKDIQGELFPLFVSREGQVELAQAMMYHQEGITSNTPYGRLASIINKYYDRGHQKLRSVGIVISKLDKRVGPNIHDANKIMKLSSSEAKSAKTRFPNAGDPAYEAAFQRWKDSIITKLDEDLTFKKYDIDVNNESQVDKFMREAFDNIVNKNKTTNQGVSFSKKYEKERVLHWKDAQSMVDYNTEFGSGAIQDSILRELTNMFGMVEVIKDWGTNPTNTLNRTLTVMDQNPILKQRSRKEIDRKKLTTHLNNLISQEGDYPGTIDSFVTAVATLETITKMGGVTLASIGDVYNVSKVARQVGRSRFDTISNVLVNFLVGTSKEDKEIFYRFLNNSVTSKLGSVSRNFVNPYKLDSYASRAVHYMFKFNLLERWDNGNRAYIASALSENIADNRGLSFDKLTDNDREILGSYNIDANEWDLIRKTNVKVGSRAQYITPDSVQYLSDEVVGEHLAKLDGKPASKARISNYRDNIESKLNNYFRDRIDHAIVSPDSYDKSLLTFGIPKENQIRRGILRTVTIFKLFGIAQFRKTILPILREKGANNLSEMIFSGKSNWLGVAQMAAETMALSYAVITAKNLSQGLGPPDIQNAETWKTMSLNSAGIFAMAFGIDLKNPISSGARQLAGPALTDAEKASRLTANFISDYSKGMGYQKTKQSSYQLVKGLIPFNTFITKWLVNHLFLNALEDDAYPGKRQRDLRHIQQKTGAKQLF